MPRILGSIVVTKRLDGGWHVVPFGLIEQGDQYVVAPFRPSPSIVNLQHHPYLSASAPSDIRVLAGCVTDRREWPLVRCDAIDGMRLKAALGHAELAVTDIEDDPTRPRFRCRVVHRGAHHGPIGYNRAQAAVLEAAILSTRLHILEPAKILTEMTYLAIAVSKTAGPAELEAWSWIGEKVRAALKLEGPAFVDAPASVATETVI